MSATARPPRGLLNQQAWAAIVRVYAAGDGGLVLYFSTVWRSVASWESAPKWSTVVRLRNRKVPYVEEIKIDGQLIALAGAEVEARNDGNTAESVRLRAEADSHRQPSACGHWAGRDRAFGASCGHRRPRAGI